MKKAVFTEKAPKPLASYSQAIITGNTVYISGQVPIDPSTGKLVKGDIKVQTIRVIENIKAIVEAAGGALEDIVKVSVYLSDKSLYPGFNEVYSRYFDKNLPARTTVEACPPKEGILIEMDAIAYLE